MKRNQSGSVIRNVIMAYSVIFLISMISCDDSSDKKIQQNNRAFKDFKESNNPIPRRSGSIITATITRTMLGRTINSNKTMLISIDKGSEDGVYVGLVGYFLIHAAGINEFRAIKVNQKTAIMEGWYYPNIHEQAQILLTLGNVSSQDVWDYIKREGIQAPPWEEF